MGWVYPYHLKLVLILLRLHLAFCNNGALKRLGVSKITFHSHNFTTVREKGIAEKKYWAILNACDLEPSFKNIFPSLRWQSKPPDSVPKGWLIISGISQEHRSTDRQKPLFRLDAKSAAKIDDFGIRQAWVLVPVLRPTSCVTQHEFLNLFELQFFHLCRADVLYI